MEDTTMADHAQAGQEQKRPSEKISDEKDRKILLLSFFDGLSFRQIAVQLSVTYDRFQTWSGRRDVGQRVILGFLARGRPTGRNYRCSPVDPAISPTPKNLASLIPERLPLKGHHNRRSAENSIGFLFGSCETAPAFFIKRGIGSAVFVHVPLGQFFRQYIRQAG
jgi:hypothetical protein